MSRSVLRVISLYLACIRSSGLSASRFAELRLTSRFICVSEQFFNWSNKGEMQI